MDRDREIDVFKINDDWNAIALFDDSNARRLQGHRTQTTTRSNKSNRTEKSRTPSSSQNASSPTGKGKMKTVTKVVLALFSVAALIAVAYFIFRFVFRRKKNASQSKTSSPNTGDKPKEPVVNVDLPTTQTSTIPTMESQTTIVPSSTTTIAPDMTMTTQQKTVPVEQQKLVGGRQVSFGVSPDSMKFADMLFGGKEYKQYIEVLDSLKCSELIDETVDCKRLVIGEHGKAMINKMVPYSRNNAKVMCESCKEEHVILLIFVYKHDHEESREAAANLLKLAGMVHEMRNMDSNEDFPQLKIAAIRHEDFPIYVSRHVKSNDAPTFILYDNETEDKFQQIDFENLSQCHMELFYHYRKIVKRHLCSKY